MNLNFIKPYKVLLTFYLVLISCANPVEESVIKETIGANNIYCKIDSINKLGSSYVKLDKEKAIRIATEGLNLAKEVDYKEGIAVSYRTIGKAYYKLGNYGKSLENYSLANTYLTRTNDPTLLAVNYNDIALIYNTLEKPKMAIQYNDLCYNLLKDKGDPILLLNYYLNYADSYCLLKQYDKQIGYLNKIIELRKGTNEINNIGIEYNNLGYAYWKIHKFDSALYFYESYLSASMSINDSLGIARAYSNIGSTLYSKELYRNSIDYFFKAIALNQSNKSHSYLELVNSFANMKNIEKAVFYFNLARKEKNVSLQEVSSSCKEIVKCYKRLNLLTKALEYSELSYEIEKELNKLSKAVITVHSKSEIEEIEVKLSERSKNELVQEQVNSRMQKENAELQRKYSIALSFAVILLFIIIGYIIYRVRKNYVKKDVVKKKYIEKDIIFPEIEKFRENNQIIKQRIEKDNESRKILSERQEFMN